MNTRRTVAGRDIRVERDSSLHQLQRKYLTIATAKLSHNSENTLPGPWKDLHKWSPEVFFTSSTGNLHLSATLSLRVFIFKIERIRPNPESYLGYSMNCICRAVNLELEEEIFRR